MAQVGFFTKKQVGDPEPAAKKAKAERATAKPKAEHVLPPGLKVSVPDEKKKAGKKAIAAGRPQAELDIECYSNYFLVKFKLPNGSYIAFEMGDDFAPAALDREGIQKVLDAYEVVSFNGLRFDIPLLEYAMQKTDCTPADLKAAADDIIKNELAAWRFADKHRLRALACDHFDLSELCPPMTSLKLMGTRLHCRRLQELPYDEASVLTAGQMDDVAEYCGNDLDVTAAVKAEFAEDVELRRDLGARYGVDLRSRSDAQCAEDIFKAEAERRTGKRIARSKDMGTVEFFYKVPDFIKFTDPQLTAVVDILRTDKFTAIPVNKGIAAPERLAKLKITLGGMVYSIGIGGLHSTEKSAFHLADDDCDLWDFDVTSYYPAIILNAGLYPPALGPVFLDIYKEIVDERIAAKRAGDKIKADGMKITVNGAFGKLGSPWSVLYAPDLMIQVTLTGQLSVLMLIDMLVCQGIEVVSGNTDGVVVKPKRGQEDLMRAIVKRWEARTGFATEDTHYAGLWSRDVNNYLAIGHDGKVKAKGTFGYAGRKKNPEHDVCTDALVEYLKRGTPVDETIRACRDIRKFLSVRQVNGGAVKAGEHVGKVVRWYYSTAETGAMHYATTGNKVPQTDGARPVMILPDELPGDIDYAWYARKCADMFY